jgi:hypothetical protein
MASLALHGIHQLVNSHPRALCERVFNEQTPPRSVESRRLLSSFDLLAFSVAFEEQWVLLPRMLKSAGIPPRFRDRNESHPVILVGGIAARLNPAPASQFADLVVGGDAECVLPEILEHLEQGRGGSREKLLAALSEIEGDPRYENSGAPVAQRIFDPPSSFNRMVLVETGRGCPAGCRFCAVAHARRPPVFFPAAEVLEAAREGVAMGKRVGLVGASLSRPHWVLRCWPGPPGSACSGTWSRAASAPSPWRRRPVRSACRKLSESRWWKTPSSRRFVGWVRPGLCI